ncbi:hypothetical protein LTR10_006087 [Elasticomyces elasticus]|nr:hypothetical protein LTR10_006087 [Elasticomyces elasticus]KAK4966860.1 hypothetical protein LTR42_011173 [Elasticomyces elasticus]
MPGTKRSKAEDDEAPCKKRKQHTAQPTARTISTRSMSRTSVSNAVFQTTELLENILYFLQLKGLLIAQMVCSKWRDVITQVEHFRQALFLEPAVPKAAWKWTMLRGNCHTLERLDIVPPLTSARKFEDGISLQASLHPLLKFTETRDEFDKLQSAGGDIFTFAADARWRKKPGSWRHMFITQPPALSVYGELFSGDPDTGGQQWKCTQYDFEDPNGVTLGDLVDHGRKLEAEGKKVNWDRCWFEAHCRACWTDEEAEEAMHKSGSTNHRRF